jgi:hypothetical protein
VCACPSDADVNKIAHDGASAIDENVAIDLGGVCAAARSHATSFDGVD